MVLPRLGKEAPRILFSERPSYRTTRLQPKSNEMTDFKRMAESLCGHPEASVVADQRLVLPCPFCGGTDIRFDRHGPLWNDDGKPVSAVWSTACYDCGATFPNRASLPPLVEAWNRRPDGQNGEAEAPGGA